MTAAQQATRSASPSLWWKLPAALVHDTADSLQGYLVETHTAKTDNVQAVLLHGHALYTAAAEFYREQLRQQQGRLQSMMGQQLRSLKSEGAGAAAAPEACGTAGGEAASQRFQELCDSMMAAQLHMERLLEQQETVPC